VLILGGAKREENFTDLFAALPKNVRCICVCGENARDINACAAAAGFENISTYDDIMSALRAAFETAKSRGYANILFSPSSKSFDSFSDYKMRGRHFDSCVRALRAEL